MKQLSSRQLGLTFAGSFLGAGYVSGQELWQFFGRLGGAGYAGLLLAMALIFLFGLTLFRVAQATGAREMDQLVAGDGSAWLRAALNILQAAFLFGLAVIMCAGAGALFRQVWGIPAWLGGLLFSGAVVLVALRGIRGVVDTFSALVPVLAAATVAIGIAARFWISVPAELPAPAANPLLHWWPVSAVIYFSYNVFSTLGVLSPLGSAVKDRKTLLRGLLLGSAVLLAIALSVLTAVKNGGAACRAELPMLAAAGALSPVLANVYALLLLLAMFGSCLCSMVALLDVCSQKFPAFRARRKTWLAVLSAAALGCSTVGFGALIGVIYPAFGIVNLFFLAVLARRALRICPPRRPEFPRLNFHFLERRS
ncbi:MAG: hypothetical protein LKJ80_05680 [Oscillibacter sp.]|jgi:uncharacterized membrane protein YkvI|nr:hypothetical protein [Oscillibacter sp.]